MPFVGAVIYLINAWRVYASVAALFSRRSARKSLSRTPDHGRWHANKSFRPSCPKLRCEVAPCSACCQPETAPSALRHRMSQEVIGGRRLPPLFGAVAAEHGDECRIAESPERRGAPQHGRVVAVCRTRPGRHRRPQPDSARPTERSCIFHGPRIQPHHRAVGALRERGDMIFGGRGGLPRPGTGSTGSPRFGGLRTAA